MYLVPFPSCEGVITVLSVLTGAKKVIEHKLSPRRPHPILWTAVDTSDVRFFGTMQYCLSPTRVALDCSGALCSFAFFFLIFFLYACLRVRVFRT